MDIERKQPNNTPSSLISYDIPIYVDNNHETKKETEEKPSSTTENENKSNAQLREILDSAIPPQYWHEDNATWMRKVSMIPSNRTDVLKLQEALNNLLMERQSRAKGICDVREDVYSQCFDELIRQTTIDCPERGILLLRIRDEIDMTLDAYKTLYDSSITFGVRKQVQAEEGMDILEDKLEKLREEKQNYEYKVLELTNKLELIEKRAAEKRSIQEKRHREEADFLKYQGHHLDSFLKSTSTMAK